MDKIADLIFNIRDKPITPAEEAHTVKAHLVADKSLQEEGNEPGKLINEVEKSGKFYVSNALINENFLLRMCIVNFRTNVEDIHDFEHFIIETGRIAIRKFKENKS